MEWSGKFNSKPYDLALPHMDKWRLHNNIAFFRSPSDQLIKRLIICRSAVGVAGAILLHGTNKYPLGSHDLRPTDRG
jgi:hypothetical protein